jgi:hypothetical protein
MPPAHLLHTSAGRSLGGLTLSPARTLPSTTMKFVVLRMRRQMLAELAAVTWL